MLCTAVVAVLLVGCGSSSSANAVTLEPADATGEDPFTSSVAAGRAAVLSAKVVAIIATARTSQPTDAKTHTRVATGTAPGLYGGSGDVRMCDPQQLVAFLEKNAEKAAAWSGVLGIPRSKIAAYVGSLTPVVLTSDTVVTNHGFRDGHATALQSVLQAGTAVMVDATGTPRVKCNCGNPLTPPEPVNVAKAHTSGTRWDGYGAANVTTIRAGATVNQLTLINITTGERYTHPIGSGVLWVAAKDNPLAVGGTNTSSTIATSTDGSKWSDVSTIKGVAVTGLAYGSGTWVAVATSGDPISGGTVLTSTDLEHWSTVAEHLLHLDAVAYGDGRWVAVGGEVAGVAVGGLNHATRVEYTSTDATHWTEVDLSNITVSDANMQTLWSVGYGDGTWLAAGLNERDDSTGRSSSAVSLATFTSTDGTRWTKAEHWDATLSEAQAGTGFDPTAVAHASGRWALAASLRTGGPALRTSPDGKTWAAVPGSPFQQHPIEALATGAATWLAAALVGPESDGSLTGGPSNIYSSTNGTSWKQAGSIATHVSALAYGSAPGATTDGNSGTSSPSSTTLQAPTTPPTTTSNPPPAGGSAPPCSQAVFQGLLDARSPGARALQVWCSGTWAIVHTSTATYGLVAWHFDGDIWSSLGEYQCGTTPPSGLPPQLIGQMCEHG
jgi:hypothetical protein